MPTSFYDVIVLGDELSGLLAATLCARRGLRVLVSQTVDTPPERYSVGKYNFAPTPIPFSMTESSAIRRVISELNFTQTLKRRLVDLVPSFQVVLPDARIDIGRDPDILARDLAREFPEHIDALTAFVNRSTEVSKIIDPVLGQDVSIPPSGFWEKRELGYSDAKLPGKNDDLLPGVPEGHPARALIALPAAFTLSTDPRVTTPTAIARSFDLWRRGATLLDGGEHTLRHMLSEKLKRQHAGDIRTIHKGKVETRWGKVQNLNLRDRKESLGTNALLCASPMARLDEYFDKPPKRLAQIKALIRPAAYRYVLHFVVSEAGIPEGLGKVAFVVADPKKPLIDDNAFALYLSDLEEEARVVVTLVANVATPEDDSTLEAKFARLRPIFRRHLEDMMYFSGDHILLTHSPNEARPPEGKGSKEIPRVLPAEPLWSSSFDAFLGVGGAPYDFGLKNASTVSTQNLPGLGPEGEFAAAWSAARFACSAAGKKKDHLKDEVLFSS